MERFSGSCFRSKENPFVEHMIERPTDAYLQDLNFIDQSEIDDKIKPSEVFAPLNADSSQLIAISASGHPQDCFGRSSAYCKSETIANIICQHCPKKSTIRRRKNGSFECCLQTIEQGWLGSPMFGVAFE